MLSATFVPNPAPPPPTGGVSSTAESWVSAPLQQYTKPAYLGGPPLWASMNWTCYDVTQYLRTAVVGGLGYWGLSRFEMLRDLATEAHALQLDGTPPGVRGIFNTLGFRLNFPDVGYTIPILLASGTKPSSRPRAGCRNTSPRAPPTGASSSSGTRFRPTPNVTFA